MTKEEIREAFGVSDFSSEAVSKAVSGHVKDCLAEVLARLELSVNWTDGNLELWDHISDITVPVPHLEAGLIEYFEGFESGVGRLYDDEDAKVPRLVIAKLRSAADALERKIAP